MSPAAARQRITVVVPVLNALRYLEVTLPAILEALRRVDGELIVVDNGSTDGSWEFLTEQWTERALVHRELIATIGRLRNLGAKAGTGSVLSFVDADCLLPEDYYEQALSVLAETGAVATGRVYALPDDPVWIERDWQDLHSLPQDGPVDYVPAGNFLCSRKAFEAVGGFDERLVTGEDAELCQRLRMSGFVIFGSHKVVAKHLGNPKTLGHFYRKQRWHALGMFGTLKNHWLDKPVIVTFLHLAANVVGLLLFIVSPSPVRLLALVALSCAAPGLTVLYRMKRVGRIVAPHRALLLYHLYFDARVAALGSAVRSVLDTKRTP